MGVIFLGVLFHFIGGFASGSFYIPYKKVKGWHWESYWIVGGLFSWLIIPPLAAYLTVPGFADIIRETDTTTLGLTFLFGVLWGIGGLTYGLGVRYLGVSLGSSIILGLCMVFGALIPSIYYDFNPKAGKDTFSMMTSSTWGLIVLAGLVLCIIAIIICGKAGVMKEKELKTTATDPHGTVVKTEYKFGLGMAVSIISGVLSACFNFGLEAGKPMAETANSIWKAANPGDGEFLFQNNVTYVVLLWGGLTTNFIWCMVLNARNKTFGDYTNKKTPLARNYLFAALAGTTWFLQFFFYGMGESKLGNGPSSWILHMAFIILVANMWGIVLREWSGVKKQTKMTIAIGIFTIILSVLVVGYGNNKHQEMLDRQNTEAPAVSEQNPNPNN
ncbi:MAG: L-rhamnose/proton symporter RhaT [Chitinophagaceae bacterium]|nr:L-rhamnose/proton symporter RhaT [Chitinophagaceae bacterium]